MKHILIAGCVVASCLASSEAFAQKCKPAFTETDKLTREKYDVWGKVLSDKGSWVSTSKVAIVGTIFRREKTNFIQIRVDRTESSPENAAVSSALRGVVGKPVAFGFDTGEPVTLEATEVENSGGTQGFLTVKALTRAILRVKLSDQALAGLRDSLTSRRIEFVRVTLDGDARAEASIAEKIGKEMQQQFSCFYQSLEAQGVSLSGGGQ